MNRFVELCSTTPAKMFGLFPRKGTIAVGSDADIVVFDPNRSTTLSARTLHMKVDYNPYEGRIVQGSPSHVVSRGNVIVDGDAFVGATGAGRFLRRGPSQAPAGL
jgi:dihydropyrimidinase